MKKRVAVTKRAKALLSIPRTTLFNETAETSDSRWRDAFKLERLKEAYFPDTGWTPIPDDSEIARWQESNLAAIRRTFAHFGLNPDHPSAWRLLVEYVAFAFFWKSPKTRGAPPKWTQQRMAELTAVVATFPGISDTAIAKKLANDKKSPFYVRGATASDGVSGLRKRVGKARKKLAAN